LQHRGSLRIDPTANIDLNDGTTRLLIDIDINVEARAPRAMVVQAIEDRASADCCHSFWVNQRRSSRRMVGDGHEPESQCRKTT
jgi:hypothetical protein